MTATRLAMDAAFAEVEAALEAAPTLAALYARLKQGEQDARLSLAQRALLKDVYHRVRRAHGWEWPV